MGRFGVRVRVRFRDRARFRVTTNRRYKDCADLPPAVTLDGEV